MAEILLVEDEDDIAMVLEDDLALEGYQVERVIDGETALQMVLERAFDLIILDVMLPGKDGFEVCRELRHRGIRTPLMLLTARDQEAEKVLGLELGADDYVTKPFSPLELRARVKALLRRAGEPRMFRFGNIEVDLERFDVLRAGKPLSLTPLEFKLLVVFIRHRGKVLSRDRILDLAWAPDTFITDRVVDTHITNLRKKIEPDPATPRYLIGVRRRRLSLRSLRHLLRPPRVSRNPDTTLTQST